jgi:hypothetical protein
MDSPVSSYRRRFTANTLERISNLAGSTYFPQRDRLAIRERAFGAATMCRWSQFSAK